MGVYSDQLIAGLGDLAEAIQEWGAKAVLQICHAGRCTSARYMGRQPIAPSAMPSYTGEMAREMTREEIEAIMDSFAEAARRAKTAGFDGVELHGTHGYHMAQFMSPYTNRRADAYGKDRGLFALHWFRMVNPVQTIIAARFMIERVAGHDIPVQMLSRVGGNRTLRGYVQDRYLDRVAGIVNQSARISLSASIRWSAAAISMPPQTNKRAEPL